MKSVELFTGAGGLAIKTAKAGFDHSLVERDQHSCHTIRENQHKGVSVVRDWCIHQMDVVDFDFSTVGGEIDLLAGRHSKMPK
ncbi:MAG: hypothetical protein SAL70_06685 [Scytonema sp. PMC 1070.18]|nr:hypothetical protein [Scytonema sp. PMC 1070.18]